MIEIKDKTKCCGCGACEQVCPKHSITMREDSEGFLYPHVNKDLCIDCGLCNKVCQYDVPFQPASKPIMQYGYVTHDVEERKNSSSGAFFMAAAKHILNLGGIVFGSMFDSEWSVVVGGASDLEEIKRFQGSKYVQSRTGDSFRQIKEKLESGLWVLFCGTPCQVSGLNHYLRKDYEKLISIDFTCHAVPSPGIWREYLKTIAGDRYQICYVNFRNKEVDGWRNYGLQIDGVDNYEARTTLVYEGNKQNLYMQGFLKYLYCRPSCSNCAARGFNTHSDIMIGDFWHVEHYHDEALLNDNNGVSLVMTMTPKGQNLLDAIRDKGFLLEVNESEIELDKTHQCILKSERPHRLRSLFFKMKNILGLRFSIWLCVKPYQKLINLIYKFR